MKEFPKLYKRNKNSKILEWSILVSDINGYPYILSTQGQLEGKKQQYKEEIKEGKQKRTAYEQAVSEAQSQWNSKRDQGYKSLEDLGVMSPDLTENGKSVLGDLLDQLLPKSNTDANGLKKPMLAKSLAWTENDKRVKFPCYIQPKFNGVRCLCFLNEDKIVFLSREGKEYTPTLGHLAEELAPIFINDPSLILDGEIYHHGTPLNRIISWVKDLQLETSLLEYHVYDLVNEDIQAGRFDSLTGLFTLIDIQKSKIKRVWTKNIYCDEDIIQFHTLVKQEKYEGAMIRFQNALYESGVRSNNLIKVKMFQEEEFEITGAILGKRGARDMVFTLKTKDNKSFEAAPIGTTEERQAYYDNIYNIRGKKGTVKFLEYTEYGKPFNPIFVAIRDYAG